MGQLQTTGKPLDVAIMGRGFFKIDGGTDRRDFYTRSGNFRVSDDNFLVTSDGRKVLDTSGKPITMNLTGEPVVITREGQVRIGPKLCGQIGLYVFRDENKLQRFGSSLFVAPPGLETQTAAIPEMRQAILEGSNVSPISELIAMIRTERSYQVDQKAIESIDDMTAKRIEAASS